MYAPPISVLIVDDDPVFVMYLRRLVEVVSENFSCMIKSVGTGRQGLEELQTARYDLLLLDYHLPDNDGLTVLAQVRSLPQSQQPAVVMLTGEGSESVAVEAMKRGAKDYLSKIGLEQAALARAMLGALERRRLEEQLARSTQELREKNAQMEADLAMAREIQLAMLPRQYPTFPAGAKPEQSALRFHHRYEPSGAVGGDFFAVLRLSDTAAGLFLCDVMGHGVRSALVTAILRGLVEELTPRAVEPDRFLADINNGMIAVLRQADTPMFASAFYLVADLADGMMRYANAGHPSPLHLRLDAGAVESLNPDRESLGPALGLVTTAKFPVAARALSVGDRVMVFTDGLFEVEGPHQEEYGQQRLLAAVRQRVALPLPRLFDELFEEVRRFQQSGGAQAFADDISMIGMEVRRLTPPATKNHEREH